MKKTTDDAAMSAIRAAEGNADGYRMELLDANTENDQLLYEYNRVYDITVGISNRIEAVKHWGAEPSTILDEIEEMLGAVVE